MVSSGKSSSGSSQIGNSGSSSEDPKALMRQRKQKRMQSNRESARRSRQRKQSHLDDLAAQASQLRKESGEIAAALSLTTQHYLAVEADNSVLRAQMMELSTRLQALNEISNTINGGLMISHGGFQVASASPPSSSSSYSYSPSSLDGSLIFRQRQQQQQQWSLMAANQPMMASIDMFQYC